MGLPVVVNLDAYRGDTWAQTFRFLTGTTPLDLTGATVAASARTRAGSTPLVAVIADETDGQVTIALPEASLDPAIYDYDVEVAMPDGTVTTWVQGRLNVHRDVTNELPL